MKLWKIKVKKNKSWQQTEVLNYHKAIEHGVKLIKSGDVISTRMIKELHAILMEDDRGTVSNKGEFRKIQNFIGPDKKRLYTKSGAWKNSSPGFQFLYTKRQISNIIKV